MAAIPDGDAAPELAELDLSTQRVTRSLFVWEGLPSATSVIRVAPDPSGRHILLLTLVNGGPGPTLYRWSEGEAQPTELAAPIDGAGRLLQDA